MSNDDQLVKMIVKIPPGIDKYLLDFDLLQKLKSSCQNSCDSARSFAVYLLIDVENRSAVIRIRALRVIEVLFERSKAFRLTICDNLRTIAQAGFLIDADNDTRAAGKSSKFLRSDILQLQHLVKSIIEVWDLQFGSLYPVLHAFARYIRESLKLDIPDVNVQASVNARSASMRDDKLKRSMISKVDAAHRMLENNACNIKSITLKLEQCCKLLEHHCTCLSSLGRNVVLSELKSSEFPISCSIPLTEIENTDVDDVSRRTASSTKKRVLSVAFSDFKMINSLPWKRAQDSLMKHELRIVQRSSATFSAPEKSSENVGEIVESNCELIDNGDEDDIAWADESNDCAVSVSLLQCNDDSSPGIDGSATKDYDYGAIFSASLDMVDFLESYAGPLLSNFQTDLSEAVALFRDKPEMSHNHCIAAAGVREIAAMSLAIHRLTKTEFPRISAMYRFSVG